MAASMEELARVENAQKTISKREDRQEESELMTDHNQMLEEMSPSCLAISVLGRLMLVTHEKDVSLNERPPRGGFQYIKYPNSLRASLVQVSNDGHAAFMAAHVNMDQIRLLTRGIPDLLREVVLATAKGTDKDVEITTRDALEKLGRVAKRCTDLARATKVKYEIVTYEIAELLEASASTKSHQEQILKENMQRLEALKDASVILEEEKRLSEARKEDMKKQVQIARDMHKSAVDTLPTGGEIIGAALVDCCTQAVTTILSAPSNLFGGKKKKDKSGKARRSSTPDSSSDEGESDCKDVRPLLTTTQTINLLQQLLHCFSVKQGNKSHFQEPENFTKIEMGFEKFIEDLKKVKSQKHATKEIIDIEESLLSECKNIRKVINSRSIHEDSGRVEEIKKRLENQLCDMRAMETKLNRHSNTNPTPSRTPSRKRQQVRDPPPSTVSAITGNAHFKVQQAQEVLKDYENRNFEAEKHFQESRASLQQTMSEIKQLDLTKTDMESIQITLRKGFHALTRVSEIWADLVRFFSKISNMVEVTFYEDVIGFKTKATNMLDYQSDFNRALMYDYAKNATQSSMAIHSLSSMYVEVSDKFLMPPLAKLPKLIFVQEGQSVETLALELDRDCDNAVAKIGEMAHEKREKYSKRVKQRLEKIEAARRSLPPIPVEQQQMNQKAIQEGLDVDPDDY